jgi:hypothetical protein
MAASQFFLPYQAATINAIAEPGASLTFYQTGTTTKLPIYTTALLSTELSNPVRANGAGRFADIYLDNTQTYRLIIKDRNGTVLDDFDPYTPGTVIGFPADTNFRITPQMFGATADGVTDDSAAFVAALAYLKGLALNTGGSGFYKGSPTLFVPAGHYYMGTTAIDVNHTVLIEGEGSGLLGAGAFGCTRLRWAAASNGLRFQAANTSGNTAFDNVNIHDGTGGCVLRGICLQGGFDGSTEGDYHGLVIRNAIQAQDLNIINWPGEGVKAWAGTINGGSPVSGNVSTTCLISVKTQNCRGGIDIRGGDANVVTTINCQGYQNRWFGLLDDNGAGANTHIGMHCASNGQVTGTWQQTQCSYTTKYYALKWGGDPTVAPSGTTADTANWLYIGAGAPVTNLIPAWTATPNTFRAGGDYLTINTAGVTFIQPYSETGPFSQFNVYTQILNGTLLAQYYRGGHQLLSNGVDGLAIKVSNNNHLDLLFSGAEAGLQAYDLTTGSNLGFLVFVRGDKWWLNHGLNVSTGTLDIAGTTAIDASRNATFASTALGGGTALTRSMVYTPSITPASVAAATVAEQTFTVTGLTTADKVIVNPPAIANSTGIAGARVSAADTLAIRFTNPTAGALTPTAGTYTVLALRS